MESAATNALWSKTRLLEAGYIVEDLSCQMCGIANDTIHHRLWECTHPKASEARRECAKEAVIRRALQAGPTSLLYNCGILDHPADRVPPPAEEIIWRYVRYGVTDVLPQPAVPFIRLSGDIYVDGHASNTGVRECDRATWAAVELDSTNNVAAYVSGTVPATMLQNSQGGEYWAAEQAVAAIND